MDEIISSLESTYDCAMTQHKSAPDDKEKEKRQALVCRLVACGIVGHLVDVNTLARKFQCSFG